MAEGVGVAQLSASPPSTAGLGVVGFFCVCVMGDHTKPLDRGSRDPGSFFCLTRCSSPLFPPNADSMHSSAAHRGSTAARDAAFVKVSVANAASQHGSTAGMTGDADPMKGISGAPIV